MPFLFVDYDQGAGGERFCAGLGQSKQCEDLQFIQYPTGRTKVKDIFGQEFLTAKPNINVVESHYELYTIVPTHRQTELAKKLLKDMHSIRIQMPTDPQLHKHIINQRINKVLLTQEPTPEYFFGLLKLLVKKVGNKEFIKKINNKMTTLEILMISQGIAVTPNNIEKYLDTVRNERYSEPNFEYDLIIPYKDLVYDPDGVRLLLKNNFGIDTTGTWLHSYAIN